ncbi:short-chain dehydrogenase [Reichenbachiella sp. 5M10]|uniref:glucose 1-dehydrogenase n=1 Tax=Reichenbachiella sp. 5M10 TaxID=1889772 RepID=UPI000C14ADDF|nr:glucose 1-dehydrogenase [Reichenbachiella sp. 5M10]PIB36952.1 short-chain dehydrogenase [Reichenbachiella sp. 5M10]
MSRLENKVALITGGNSGIGLATAKLFVAQGAKVVITGRRQEALDTAVKEIGGDVIAVLADVKDIGAGTRAIEQTVEQFGHIDILFLNAGIAGFMPIAEMTEEFFDEQFDTNVKGPFFMIKSALPYLSEGAVIIGNTSIVSQKGFPGSGVYSATKAAMRSLSRVLTNELQAKKIRAVSVAPGPIDTPIYGKMGMSEAELQGMSQGFAQQVPLGRFGTSEELAQTVLFLASDEASFITGVELEVDGGLSQV